MNTSGLKNERGFLFFSVIFQRRAFALCDVQPPYLLIGFALDSFFGGSKVDFKSVEI
jgi:hypothetical protein